MSLGSIIVRLTMNTADFVTDAGRAAKVAQRRAKEIDDAFRKAGAAIGTVLGAAALSAGVAIKSSIDRMDELSKASQKVGMPTEEFSRLAYAGELADVSMETLVGSLGKLTKAQAAALKETSEQAKVFDALGIAATNADGSLRPASEVLGEFADRFKAMEGSPEAMAAGFALFGRSFQEMIPLLKGGSAGLRDAADESDRLGVTLTTTAGEAAEEFNDNLTRLQRAVGGVWMEISSGMLPQLNQMTGDLVTAAGETDNLRQFGEGLATVLRGLGSGFAFVAGMTKQFTIDTVALSDALIGYAEAARNIGSLGLAPGTVSGGMNRASNAFKTRREIMADQQRAQASAAARAEIDRLTRNGVQYDGPLLAPSKALEEAEMAQKVAAVKEARRQAEALRKALGDPDPKAPRGSGGKKASSRAPEISEEAKAVERLNEQAARDLESLKERLGLMGLETEAAKMKWETEEGSFKALDPLRKAELIAQAALVDAKQKALDTAEAERRAAEDAREGYARAIADIQSERDTLGMTNEQLEIYNRLKWAGVDANSAFGQSIIDQTRDLQRARKLMEDQIGLMDEFRGAARGFVDDIYNGANAWDALKDAFDRFADAIFDFASKKVMEQLFGQMGSSQTGSAGNWIADLIGAFAGAFSGGGGGGGGGGQFGWIGNGYARGGYTGPGGPNDPAGIVHRGEVVWSQGDVARAGGVATVEAMRQGRGGGRPAMVVEQHFHNPRLYDRRSDTQRQAQAAMKLRESVKFA